MKDNSDDDALHHNRSRILFVRHDPERVPTKSVWIEDSGQVCTENKMVWR